MRFFKHFLVNLKSRDIINDIILIFVYFTSEPMPKLEKQS